MMDKKTQTGSSALALNLGEFADSAGVATFYQE